MKYPVGRYTDGSGSLRRSGISNNVPRGRGLALLVGITIIASACMLFVALLIPDANVISDPAANSTLRFTAQTIAVFVSFGVFFIQWLPPRQLKTVQSIFIASAFLSIGLLTFAHMMTCSVLVNVTGGSDEPIGSFFHMMVGVTMAGALLIASRIPSRLPIRKGDSNLILMAFLAYTSTVAVVAAVFGPQFPTLCPHDIGADPIRLVIEALVTAAMVIAALVYFRVGRTQREMSFFYLAGAALTGAFSHFAFSLHAGPLDGYSVLALAFTIASFALVFVALFSTSVMQPYDRLRRAQGQSERRRREAEAATVKAQTYLDFLSHDIANMISPIMNRAEIILESGDASGKDKEEARKIVEQTQKVASLIENLRRLSRTERVDAKGLGTVDLKVLFSELERTRSGSHPDLRMRVAVLAPRDTDVLAVGGNVVEEIVTEVFDNAVKHAGHRPLRVAVNITPVRRTDGAQFWRIEVTDNGPGIPDHVKASLNLRSSDPGNRFTRGVASSLSIMSLIAEQMGGSIRVEDRVPGNSSKGARVMIIVPRAP